MPLTPPRKDPRYGRNSELPGECPFLAGTYADHYTQGMQQVSEKTGFYKMLSYLKHYTAYNKEADRFSWKANVTDFDMLVKIERLKVYWLNGH